MTLPITLQTTSSPNGGSGASSSVPYYGASNGTTACVYPPPVQQQPPSPFSYVLLQLQRPNCMIPWGMSLSLFEGRYLVVGNVDLNSEVHHHHLNHGGGGMTRTCWSTRDCHMNPSPFWITTPRQHGASAAGCLSPHQVSSFVQSLVTMCPYDPSLTIRRILPGDCILAMNGNAVAATFSTLDQATRFMQAQTHLLLIVLRLHQQHPPPITQNFNLYHQQKQTVLSSPTCALRFPMQQEENKAVMETARQTWQSLRFLDLQNYQQQPLPPPLPTSTPPSTASMTMLSYEDSLNVAADALLSLHRGGGGGGGGANSSLQLPRPVTLFNGSNNNNNRTLPSHSPPIPIRNPLFRQEENKQPDGVGSNIISSSNDKKEQEDKKKKSNSFYSFSPGYLLYADDTEEADPDEGQRARLFLNPIDASTPESFGRWLQQRKSTWRQSYKVHAHALYDGSFAVSSSLANKKGGDFVLYRNPLFKENPELAAGNKVSTKDEAKSSSRSAAASLGGGPRDSCLPYADDLEWEPDDGQRAHLFLKPVDTSSPESFGRWLHQRKRKWRESYKVYPVEEIVEEEEDEHEESHVEDDDQTARHESNVPVDFWSSQGHSTFQHWLSARKAQWKCSYSWNQRKRRRIQEDCEDQVVCLISPSNDGTVGSTSDEFAQWLRVRKNQWRVLRRKRQRERLFKQSQQQQVDHDLLTEQQPECSDSPPRKNNGTAAETSSPATAVDPLHQPSFQTDELLVIDALLEDQERERLAKEARKPVDISFLFDSSLQCPDDVVVHCFQYLDPMEHGKLLSINREKRQALMKRERVWRQLCPSTWKLPRRPRKPWHVMYLTTLRRETERARKRCDDLLARAANILLKGDQLQAIEKLCAKAEKDNGATAIPFDVNYSSGVVCERNSLLNLAVIHQRHKVVKWLVEVKHADIEAYDRGGFTPLLNAAWAGDKYLVRFFLAAGANRGQIGTCHYTRPLAAPDFEGLDAAGWARRQGHDDIAKLIELGL